MFWNFYFLHSWVWDVVVWAWCPGGLEWVAAGESVLVMVRSWDWYMVVSLKIPLSFIVGDFVLHYGLLFVVLELLPCWGYSFGIRVWLLL